MVSQINPALLEAEYDRAARKGGGKKFGDSKPLFAITVVQSKLPHGTTTFRVLPPTAGVEVPWVKGNFHEIWNNTDVVTEKRVANITCSGTKGCVACKFIDAIATSPIKGADKTATSGAAVEWRFMNVRFLTWGGGSVPENRMGNQVLKFKRGIYKGVAKNEVGGILALTKEHGDALVDVNDGLVVSITRTGEGVDTNYKVDIVTVKQALSQGKKSVMVDVPVTEPLADSPEETQALLNGRIDLLGLINTPTASESVGAIEGIDFTGGKWKSAGPGDQKMARTAPGAGVAAGEQNGDDDIPF